MKIISCLKVTDEAIFKVFNEGYSDYFMKLEMSLEIFKKHFLEKDAKKEYSFLACDGEKPVGVILGDVKIFQGIKTMRCGAFAVVPEYRNKGVGQMLYEAHKALALDLGCKQLFLEVLKENTKAYKFYKKVGYSDIHDYRMYVNECIHTDIEISKAIVPVDLDTVYDLRKNLPEIYINWQNEIFTKDQLEDQVFYAVMGEHEVSGLIALKRNGGIQFIWVRNELRNKGYGAALLYHGLKALNLTKCYAISSNNMAFEGFLKRRDFKLRIEQHEMMQLI
ncbi:MAG: GNAT family N-acetyltransferase [Clostridia bacterium]|nr:GNAT family N-acetyltransferase [Clostridia bacterium]